MRHSGTLFTWLILVAYVSAASFREEPISTQATIGDTVTLNCAVDGDLEGVSVFWWNINSSRAVSQDSRVVPRFLSAGQISRYSIVGNSTAGGFNLQIDDVTRTDISTYSCRIWDGTLWHFSRQVTLDVVKASPDCTMQVYRPLPVEVGERVKLSCESYSTDPTVQLHWLSRGRAIQNIETLSTNSLSIIQPLLTEQDYDVPFMCLETTSKKRKTCQITPLHRQIPVIVQDRLTTAFDGDIATFTCTTGRAQTSLAFSWYVDDVLQPETSPELSLTAEVVNNGSRVKCYVLDPTSGLSGENDAMLVVLTRPLTTTTLSTTTTATATATSTAVVADTTTPTHTNIFKTTINMPTTVDSNAKSGTATTRKIFTMKPGSNKARFLSTARRMLESDGGTTTTPYEGEILPEIKVETPKYGGSGIASTISNNKTFMMGFVIGSLLVGMLLIVLIVLLIVFLARQAKHTQWEDSGESGDKPTHGNLPMADMVGEDTGVVGMAPRGHIRENNVDYAILDPNIIADDDSLSGFRMRNELLTDGDDSSPDGRTRDSQTSDFEIIERTYLSDELMIESEAAGGVSAYAISTVPLKKTKKKSRESEAPPAPVSSRPCQRDRNCSSLHRPLPAEPKNPITRHSSTPRRYINIAPGEVNSGPTPPVSDTSPSGGGGTRRILDGERVSCMAKLGEEEDYAEIHEMSQKSPPAGSENIRQETTTDKYELSRLKSLGELSSTQSVGSQEDSALGSGSSSEALAIEECPYATIADAQRAQQRQSQQPSSMTTKADDTQQNGPNADVSLEDIVEPEADSSDNTISRQKSKMPVYARVDKSKKKKKLQKRDSKTAKDKESKASWQCWLENVVASSPSGDNKQTEEENAMNKVKGQHITCDNYATVWPHKKQAPAHV